MGDYFDHTIHVFWYSLILKRHCDCTLMNILNQGLQEINEAFNEHFGASYVSIMSNNSQKVNMNKIQYNR